MVYPLLDCKAGFPLTVYWQSGSLTRRALSCHLKAGPTQFSSLKNASRSCLHLPVEGQRAGRQLALGCKLENRERFQQAFSRGLAVLGFARDAEGNGIYELGQLTQPEAGIQAAKEN